MISNTERETEGLLLEILELKCGHNNKYKNYLHCQTLSEKYKKIKSKSGVKYGRPEFFMEFKDKNVVFVVECKKDIKYHKDAIQDLNHYINEIRKIDKNVRIVGAAFSGNLNNRKFDLIINNDDKKDINIKKEFTFEEIYNFYIDDVMDIDKLINKFNLTFHGLGIPPKNRSHILCSIIYSFENKNFYDDIFKSITSINGFINSHYNGVESFLNKYGIADKRKEIILRKIKESLKDLEGKDLNKIKDIGKTWYFSKYKIKKMVNFKNGYDVSGKIFEEFLRYGDKSKKVNGQVLTPNHISDLMTDIADLQLGDAVIDIACGTGSFLVKAFRKIYKKAKTKEQKENVKNNAIWGIDNDPDMVLLSIINLIIHGDGKNNIFKENSLLLQEKGQMDYENPEYNNLYSKITKDNKITHTILNPPYENKSANIPPEPTFILKASQYVKQGGMVVAIHPISMLSKTKYKNERNELMNKNTLLATMICNPNIFNAGVETAISVWRVGKPHTKDDKVWFANWSDDGHISVKNKHRVDVNNTWKDIKNKWINEYKQRIEIDNKSVLVDNIDENKDWTLYPYIPVNYDNPNFLGSLEQYLNYSYLVGNKVELNKATTIQTEYLDKFKNSKKKYFKIKEIFDIKKPKALHTKNLEYDYKNKNIPYITRTKFNNGHLIKNGEFVYSINQNNFINDGNCLIVGGEGATCFYQQNKYTAGNNITSLYLKDFNFKRGIFIKSLIDENKFKYSYNRALNKEQLSNINIPLPVNNEGKIDWKLIDNFINFYIFPKLLNEWNTKLENKILFFSNN